MSSSAAFERARSPHHVRWEGLLCVFFAITAVGCNPAREAKDKRATSVTHVALAPLAHNRPGLFLSQTVEVRRRGGRIGHTLTFRRLDVIDLSDGRRIARRLLPRKPKLEQPICRSRQPGSLWCTQGQPLEISIRDASTLAVSHSFDLLVQKFPALREGIVRVRIEPVRKDLLVVTGSGDTWLIKSDLSSSLLQGAAPAHNSRNYDNFAGRMSGTIGLADTPQGQLTFIANGTQASDLVRRLPSGSLRLGPANLRGARFLRDGDTRRALHSAPHGLLVLTYQVAGSDPNKAERAFVGIDHDGKERWRTTDNDGVVLISGIVGDEVFLVVRGASGKSYATSLNLSDGRARWRYEI